MGRRAACPPQGAFPAGPPGLVDLAVPGERGVPSALQTARTVS